MKHLQEQYFSEFEVIDGLNQHPMGWDFDTWLAEKADAENHNGSRGEQDFDDTVNPVDMMVLKNGMTVNDRALIEEARRISCYEHWDIHKLIDRADTDAARELLEGIRSFKYHMEEFHSGLL